MKDGEMKGWRNKEMKYRVSPAWLFWLVITWRPKTLK